MEMCGRIISAPEARDLGAATHGGGDGGAGRAEGRDRPGGPGDDALRGRCAGSHEEREINEADAERTCPRRRTVYHIYIRNGCGGGVLDGRLMRLLHDWAHESGRYGLFCPFCLWGLRVAYGKAVEGVEIHIEGQVLDAGNVMTARVCVPTTSCRCQT